MEEKILDIKNMKASEWSRLRTDLETKLKEANWWFTRIVRTGKTTISIEGGSIPIQYDIEADECAVWNKCSRYSRSFVPIKDLIRVKEVLEVWGGILKEMN